MPIALELSAGRIIARPSPRLVTGAVVAGTVTVDCAGASAVIVSLSLTANVTAVIYQNLPTVCLVRWRIAQSGGPWTFPASAHPAGTVVDGDEHIYPDATLTRLWWETFDGGVSAILEYNAPAGGSTGDAYAASHEADATAHPASSIVNTPAGNIAATTVQGAINELDSEKAATGHNHSGVYEPAGAVATHVAAGDPHTQYALESALGVAAALNVGTGPGTVAAGNDSRFIPPATAQHKILVRSTAGAGAWEELGSSANAFSFLQAADYAAMRTLLGLNATISDGATLATGLTFPNAGLKLLDLDGSNTLTLKWDSDDTADRSLSLRVNGSSRVLTMNASTTLNGGTIASGTAALGTSAIASGASATVVTVAATGVATTDTISWGFNATPNAVTGYNAASTTGCLVITAYPTAGNVNFLVSNPTSGSITPGALTLNWRVVR